MWWKEFVENSHNSLARQIVATETPNLWTATRMFALLNVSIYDAYIDVFENKFFYNHWRPYTAIRWVEDDGNPRTEPDPQWTNPHKHTLSYGVLSFSSCQRERCSHDNSFEDVR